MSANDIHDFLRTVRNGEIEYDSTHPAARDYQIALHTYTVWEKASVVPSPDDIRNMLHAIDIAISKGVFKLRRKDVEKVVRAIVDKKLTEQDIDHAKGASGAKKP
jgi:hypothetical protein